MKRKRGHKKKGKSKKKQALESPANTNAIAVESSKNDDVDVDGSVDSEEENSGGSEEEGVDKNVEDESKSTSKTTAKETVVDKETVKEVEAVVPEKKEQVVNLRSEGVFVRPAPTAVYGRVKLKLKGVQKPPLENNKVVASSEGVNQSQKVVDVVEKKEGSSVVVVDDGEKVEDGGKKSAGSMKIVSSKNSSPAGAGSGVLPEEEKKSEESEAKVSKQEVEDSSKNPGCIKFVYSKNSSSLDGKVSGSSGVLGEENKAEGSEVKDNNNKQELGDSSKKSGTIKIVSSKNPSLSGGKESGGGSGVLPEEKKIEEREVKLLPEEAKDNKQQLLDNSKKSGSIKIVSSKNSSPSGGKESAGSVMSLEENKTEEREAKTLPREGNYNKQELEDSSKKSGSIKIVSSKSASPSGVIEIGGSGLSLQDKKTEESEAQYNKQELEDSNEKEGCIKIRNSSPSGGSGLSSEDKKTKESEASGLSSDDKKTKDSEAKLPPREAKYNKQELEASLEVVKKIMKMDAAEPFNVPVDPIKLGIPDYFDVIDTPMDFGTICNNLEIGTKYMDSEDVYKDVQYVWDNCYKYNNKGDYIVDLMKRVKKNFMKYWAAAGLYNEQSKKIQGDESSPLDEPSTSGLGKKLKKGKGVKRHKDDCLCAICIMKRRRREREAREAQAAREAGGQAVSPHLKVFKARMAEEYKQEDNLRTESPVADTSSYMETSPDGYADAEMEDGEMRPEAISSQYNEQEEADRAELLDKSERSGDISEKSVQSDKGDAELHSRIEARMQDDSGSRMDIDAQHPPLLLPEGQTAEYLQQRNELLEMEKKRQKLRMLETFRDLENPMLLGLCGIVFPNNPQSVWSGGNSLVRCKRSCHRRDIHEAVASFVNPPCKSSSSPK